jgi:hypothetical protein
MRSTPLQLKSAAAAVHEHSKRMLTHSVMIRLADRAITNSSRQYLWIAHPAQD